MNLKLPSSQLCKPVHKLLALMLVLLVSASGMAQSRRLITGKNITYPPLGVQQNVGSLPMNVVLTPDRKYALVSDMGFEQALTVINTKTADIASNVDYPNCNYCGSQTTNGLYYGLAFGSTNGDGMTVYAAQGGNNTIDVLNLSPNGILADLGSFTATRPTDFPSGLATDTRGYLYVVDNDPATFLAPSDVAIYSQATQKEVGRYSFTGSFGGTPNFPTAIAVFSNGSKAYVASERDGAVYDLNTSDPTKPTLTSTIATGANPDGLLLNKAQTLLYVANAGSDTVSVIRTSDDKVVSSILIRPKELKNVPGTSSPTGLGLSPDGRTLFVALGDLSAIAVLDVEGGHLDLQGYVPAGWYPSAVVAPSKDSILFANAKGTTPRYPNPGYVQWQFNSSPDYDQHLIQGQISLVKDVDNVKLEKWTAEVLRNNALDRAEDHRLDGLKGKIQHVIYIVKENRTYDQVLGDVPGGNGDSSLVLFGKDITPNLHALAERFVLLDNTYVDSEVSYDGWSWSTQAIADEDTIKSAPYNYSGRGRQYDTEGQNNGYNVGGFPAKDPDGNVISPVYFPNGAPAIPDITQGAGGHIWESVQKAGLTYRNYGFFLAFGITDGKGNVIMPDNYPDAVSNQPPGHDLAGVTDWDFRRFDSNYADGEAPLHYGCTYPTATYGKHSAPSRYSEWALEFNEMIQNNSVPAFMTVRLPHDHTQGPTSGLATPAAEVADNDYAVGQLVQAISNSPIWNSTAIFIVEDDSQDGPDHVDAHRQTAFVISPWIKQNSIDHDFHNTTGMLKTIEMILGLAPLTSYDAVGKPIMDWDSNPNNKAPYTAILPDQSIVCAKTPGLETLSASDPMRKVIEQASRMDLDHPDSAPDGKLNELIWKSVKGANSVPPAPRYTVSSRDSDDE